MKSLPTKKCSLNAWVVVRVTLKLCVSVNPVGNDPYDACCQIIHKVRAGQSVVDAVEDIIQRGVAELRKNAFGDDSEDAKSLSWTRQQAWTVLKLLAQKDEVS